MLEKVIEALIPFGYNYLVSITGIPGPGNWVVIYATQGDFRTACVSTNYKVQWDQPVGGCDPDAD